MRSSIAPGLVVADTWEVEALLGRGGMGEVWQVKHLRVDGKKAALKVLVATGASEGDFVRRFKQEAELAARLEHPHIVQVFDFSVLPTGEPYMVLELLRGQTLKERLDAGPMSLATLAPLVVQLGSALHVAHARGVVHRDLKPENLFLVSTPAGDQLKVLDFGISKVAGSVAVTSNSVLLGTPAYMSPEQAMGENSALTPSSDVFAVAVICYEALSGRRAFPGESVIKLIMSITGDEPPDIEGLPAEAMRALRHALAKLPSARPTISGFVEELTGQRLNGATPPPASERALAPTVRSRKTPPLTSTAAPNRRLWLGALSLAVLAVAALAWSLRSARQDPPGNVASVDAGSVDAGEVDAGSVDAGGVDAGGVDAGEVDAGGVDAGVAASRVGEGRSVQRGDDAASPEIERAFSEGNYAEVLDLSRKPDLARVGRVRALRLMAACAQGDLGLANAARPSVTAPHLAGALAFCRRAGVDVR